MVGRRREVGCGRRGRQPLHARARAFPEGNCEAPPSLKLWRSRGRCVSCHAMQMNRRRFIGASAGAALSAGVFAGCRSVVGPAPQPIPVILATDIGDDIDDTWALGFLLKSPELSLKLVATDYGKAPYRAALLGKFLEKTGH